MAKNEQALEDIEILVENSIFNIGPDYLVSSIGFRETPTGVFSILTDDPENRELIHEQSLDIAKLYQQQNATQQGAIRSALVKNLESGEERAKTSAKALIATGQVGMLLDRVFKDLVKYSDSSRYFVLTVVNHDLFLRWDQYDLGTVRKIREWSRNYLDGKSPLGLEARKYSSLYEEITELSRAFYRQTNSYLSKDVKKRIDSGYNPEINVDKETLKKEFSRFGFPTDLSETLDKIDHKFEHAKDAFDFKGCMDLIRAFTERLYSSILDSYGAEGKKIDSKDAEAVAKFFQSKGLVSDHFATMLAAQRHFLSDKASHRLKSRLEDARLSKNMVIEMSLYLLRRFEIH